MKSCASLLNGHDKITLMTQLNLKNKNVQLIVLVYSTFSILCSQL